MTLISKGRGEMGTEVLGPYFVVKKESPSEKDKFIRRAALQQIQLHLLIYGGGKIFNIVDSFF
jgi:hypothetical protein